MKDLDIKSNVLKEIMDLMDERENEGLKKHPKLIAAKIEVGKPEVKEESPFSDEEESSDSPEAEGRDGEEISPEDLQKLLEHFKGL